MKTSRLLIAALYVSALFGCRIHAASTPISGLPAASAVAPTNLTVVVDTTEPNPALQTKKANVSQLVDGLPAASAGAKGTMSAADKTKLDNATSLATPSTLVLRDVSGNATFTSIALTGGTISGAPSNPTDIPNKAYVDAVATGLAVHNPAVAATTANITLAGGAPSTLDGVTLSTSNRILVKNQTDAKENGIYTVSVLGSGANGTWVRATDADTGSELVSGSYIFISGGTTYSNASFVMTTPGAITIGVSDINWSLYSQITNILASNIIGQIVTAQIQDAALTTAKFAAGITPVEIVGALPGSGNYAGRTVYLTTDAKLYRYNGSSFVASIPTTDLTGQITTTQITDNAVTTAKVNAGAVTTAKLAAGAVTANEIATNTITAGQIASGAINTDELAAGAVTANKILAGTITTTQIAASTILASNIAAGTITADRLNVTSLSAISANLGTVTAGTLNSVTINSTSGSIGGFTLASNKLSAIAGVATFEISALGSINLFSTGAAQITASIDTINGLFGSMSVRYNNQDRVVMQTASSQGILRVHNGSGTQVITLTGSTGNVASTSVTLSGTNTITGFYFNTTVPTLSPSATEHTINITLTPSMAGGTRPTVGFIGCASDGDVIGRYDWDNSSNTTAVFKVRRLDGAAFSGSFRFSYVLSY